MGHKSAVSAVLSNQIPVLPKCLKSGCIKQPPYFRSKNTFATSSRLLSFRSCIASAMAGKSGSQSGIRSSFTSAAKSCAGKS